METTNFRIVYNHKTTTVVKQPTVKQVLANWIKKCKESMTRLYSKLEELGIGAGIAMRN
ncbi:hypothetical protein [Aquimarina sediminis]|uniref:hypothetical protein n=1 Tax=Aquimarina sediminis TaxID=2070536 RepID=UPI0013E8DB38|nr:hypothetical protein [Aquimarina sediminis]